jgi:hypothetical protein
MRKLLESFVDSSSIFYICEVRGLYDFQQGKLCREKLGSAFVALKFIEPVETYPLYSGGSKELNN